MTQAQANAGRFLIGTLAALALIVTIIRTAWEIDRHYVTREEFSRLLIEVQATRADVSDLHRDLNALARQGRPRPQPDAR